jgi:glycosyltransferase involved in cell wall biosynthesis/2-polyprenyl-3-methyl-5-hydroxy-6-metoxy-1,4-benzoquinol methylase
MTTSPLVSVVIPAYNAEKTIVQSIDSALQQTITDLEVVVVDDGSVDGTVAAVRAITDPRVRLVEQPNGGAPAARNAGIDAARGIWLAFLDADDLFLPDKLERQLRYLDSHPGVRAVQTGVVMVDDDLRPIEERPCEASTDSLLDTLLFKNLPGLMSTLVVARSDVVAFGGFDTTLAILEDWDLAIKVSRHSNMHSIETPLALYRQHAGNRSADLDIHIAPGFSVLDRLFADPTLPTRIASRRRQVYGSFYTMLAGASLRVHRWPDLARWTARALLSDPRQLAYMAALPARRLRRRRAPDAASSRTCPACDARTSRAAGTQGGYAWRRCRTCATFFTDPLPTAAEIDAVYASYYGDAPAVAASTVEESLARLVASCAGARASNRFLDVGFGGGDLLRAAEAAGWECWGTEVAADSLAAGRDAGWNVIAGDLPAVELDPGSFDVVSFVEVLGPRADPAAHLRRAAALVRPGGVLIGTTPNGGSINRRLLGMRWSVVAAPEHLQLFSARGLRQLLQRAGFAEVAVSSSGLNPSELVARLRRRKPTQGLDRVAAGQALNERLLSTGRGRITKRAANAVLAATGLGDTLRLRAVSPSPPPG